MPLAVALQDALRGTPGAADAEQYANGPWLSAGDAQEPLLELVRAHSPMVLLLDDLHLAHPGTVEALHWLHRQAPTVPLAIIATMRSSDSEGGSPLVRLGAVDRLRLGPLLPGDSSAAHDVDEEMVHLTGGNPRLMADLWRWKKAGEAGHPPSLAEAVKKRVRGLGGCIPALLQAAAVRAEPFDLIDLVDSAGFGTPGVGAELGRLCDLEFLETTAGGFRFTAPLVRDILATTVSPERRAALAAAMTAAATITAA